MVGPELPPYETGNRVDLQVGKGHFLFRLQNRYLFRALERPGQICQLTLPFLFILSLYFLFLNQTATNVKILPLHVFSSVQAFVTQPSLDGLKKETQPTPKGKGGQETISIKVKDVDILFNKKKRKKKCLALKIYCRLDIKVMLLSSYRATAAFNLSLAKKKKRMLFNSFSEMWKNIFRDRIHV